MYLHCMKEEKTTFHLINSMLNPLINDRNITVLPNQAKTTVSGSGQLSFVWQLKKVI